jgi:hypothetical protein
MSDDTGPNLFLVPLFHRAPGLLLHVTYATA